MDKFIAYIKNFLSERTIAFYITAGIGLLSLIMGIVSGAGLAFAGNTVLVTLLPIFGLLAFVGLSLIGQDRMGAAALGLLDFGALVALVCGVYEHFLTAIQNQSMGGFDLGKIDGFFMLIVCAALIAVCAVAANVLAWLRLRKKPDPDAIAE